MSPLPHFESTCRDLDLRRTRVLEELDPTLRVKVEQICAMMAGRVAPYCGYRGPHEQQDALALGNSNAVFGESPHNYHYALACDLVLDPRKVDVRENPDEHYPGFPDLWDDRSEQAILAWSDLDGAALAVGLERVDLGRGRKDLPHVQLPGWKTIASTRGT